MTRTRAALLLGLAAASLGAAPAWAAEAEVLLAAPALDRGEPAAAQQALLAAIEADPRDPRVPYLLAELRQRWDLVPGGATKARARLEPLLAPLRDHANFEELAEVVSRLRIAAGERDAARELLEQRGLIDAWWVAGPFGTARRASLRQVFPPEVAAARREIDAGQRFAALRGERRWVPLQRDDRQAVLSLDEVVEGEGEACYLLTHLQAPAATEATLVYRGPSAKVWINRAPAGTLDRSQRRMGHEVRLPIALVAGWNRVLIKVAGGSAPTVHVRLTTRAGGPLTLPCDPHPHPVEAAPAAAQPPQEGFALAALAQEEPPQRRALYAHALLQAGLGEEAHGVLQALLAAQPALSEQAWVWTLVGRAAEQADHLPQAVRREQARTAYQRAIELEPASTAARRALARFDFRDDQVIEGALALEAVLAERPGDLRTRLDLVQALLGEGWLHPAEELLAAAPSAEPTPLALLDARATLLERRGDAAGALAIRQEILARDRGQFGVLATLLEDALAAADEAAALAVLARYPQHVDIDPDAEAALEARVWRALGDRDQELAAVRRWLAARSHDVTSRLAAARRLAEEALVDPAARAEAVALLQSVVAERPELHEATDLLAALSGEEDRFWEEWQPDLQALLAEAPGRDKWPRASTVCLFDQTVTKILPDASSVDVVHQVWRILDEAGKERYGARPRAGELLEIRTITPQGQVLEPIRTGTRTFEMPGLAPGAVVEHAFRLKRRAPDFQFTNGPFYFQDPDLTEPFWLSRWVLLVHEDAPVDIVERNLDREGITKRVEQRGPWRVHVYTAKDQPRLEPEPFAPERDELLPWIKVVERRTLDQIAPLYQERALALAQVGPTVARAAAEVTAGVSGDAQKARRLYRFVQEHVARTSGGSTPSQILAARGGSKTTLLRALLTAAGVPHDLALAGPAPHSQQVDWTLPEPGQFSVPLLRIAPRDGEPFYLLAEAHRLAPYGQLPAAVWGAPAFVCDPEGAFLDVVPAADVTSERIETEVRFSLQQGGAARVAVRRTLPGFGLYRLKETLSSVPEAQLRAFFARQAAQLMPGARVVESGTPQADVPGAPLTFAFTFEAQGAVRPRGDGTLVLRGALPPSNLRRTFGTLPHRAFDLVLSEPLASHDLIEVDLGPYTCPLLPPNVRVNCAWGHYSRIVRRAGPGELVIERRVVLRPGRVSPAEYTRDFLPFLQRVDEADRVGLILEAQR